MSGLSNAVSFVAAGTGTLAACVDHGIFRRISERLDRSVYCGSAQRRAVALTFDDGPTPETLKLLAYLRSEGLRATFFHSGLQVERYPEIVRQVHLDGHEIGNHAYSHVRLSPDLLRLQPHFPSQRFVHQELSRTQELLTNICGKEPRLFRPPYGHRWIGSDRVHRRLGLTCIQWTVIGHDWEWPAQRVAERVLQRATPGAILCLHDGREMAPFPDLTETIEALHIIVPELRRRGFDFVTVGELLSQDRAALNGTPGGGTGQDLIAGAVSR